jgi:hypothetical protein
MSPNENESDYQVECPPTPEQFREIRHAAAKLVRHARLFLPIIDGLNPVSEMNPSARDLAAYHVYRDILELASALRPPERHDLGCPFELMIAIEFISEVFNNLCTRLELAGQPDWRAVCDKLSKGIYARELLALEQANELLTPPNPVLTPGGCLCGHDLYYMDFVPSDGAECPSSFVTLEQIAKAVGKSPRTLEKRKRNGMPAPIASGTPGKPTQWRWSHIRVWAKREYQIDLPEQPPPE